MQGSFSMRVGKTQRSNLEADLLPPREPPHLDHRRDLTDPLGQAIFLHRRKKAAIRASGSSFPHHKVAGPFENIRSPGHTPACERRENVRHHVWEQSGIQPLPAHDAPIVDCEKIDGVGIIIGISFDAVFVMQISPSAFTDEHIVPQAIILFKVIFVTSTCCTS